MASSQQSSHSRKTASTSVENGSMPPKRSRNTANPKKPQTEMQKMFASFANNIDSEYTVSERIYKTTRDITKKSKNVIFFLQRLKASGAPPYLPDSVEAAHLQQASEKLKVVEGLIAKVIGDLTRPEDYWKFNRKYSFGLQEYIEAVSFYTYLSTGELVSVKAVEQRIADVRGQKDQVFPIGVFDYILGVGDLGGEMMRFCISARPSACAEVAAHARKFLRRLVACFESLAQSGARSKELKSIGKKCQELRNSLSKVENVCYKLKLRQAEFPDSSVVDEQWLGREVKTVSRMRSDETKSWDT